MHLTPKDMDAAVTTIKRETTKVEPTTSIQYNIKGESDENRKDKFTNIEVAAVKISSGAHRFYKVKADKKGHYFDMNKINVMYGLDVPDRNTQNLMFNLKEISENSFNGYLRFLQTGFTSYLTAAERV